MQRRPGGLIGAMQFRLVVVVRYRADGGASDTEVVVGVVCP